MMAEVPYRILDRYGAAAFEGGVKYVVLLREPVARTISSWEFKFDCECFFRDGGVCCCCCCCDVGVVVVCVGVGPSGEVSVKDTGTTYCRCRMTPEIMPLTTKNAHHQ